MTRPRRFVFEGVIDCAAWFVDRALVGDTRARARVIERWVPGTIVHEVAGGYLVEPAGEVRLRVRDAPGLPFVRRPVRGGTALVSAPLDAAELDQLAPEPRSLVWVRGGSIEVIAPGRQVDVASWLEVDEWTLIPASPLRDPPPAAVDNRPKVTGSARDFFSDVAGSKPAPGALALIRAVEGGEGRSSIARDASSGAWAAMRWSIARLLRPLVGWLVSARGATATKPSELARHEAARPGAFSQFLSNLSSWITRAIARSRYGELLGRRHAEYLEKLFEMLDRNDTDAALRHAIPLGKDGVSGKSPALSVLKPRADLTISPSRSRGGGSVFLHSDLYEVLRQKYRAAFERLAREGKIEEAAFVLAELLQASEEAVAFLERHRRFRLAAEVAEARGLPIGLVVRQWFLAGGKQRALQLARSRGAFGDAIARLERSQHRKEAAELRVVWAELLAQAGDFGGAIAAVWPIEAARNLALRWIDDAIGMGGALGARMLAKKISIAAETPELRALALEVVTDRSDEACARRRAFAAELAGASPTPLGRTIGRAMYRALVADASRTRDPGLKAIAAEVLELSADAGLGADRIPWPMAPTRSAAPVHVREAVDRGTVAVLDAAVVPNGRTVVALGALGVRLLDRRGRVPADFDRPAERLVVSTHGDRVIAAARCGDAWALSRINLHTKRAEAWFEAELPLFASTFDGSTWAALERAGGGRSSLIVIDALDDRLSALERFDGLGLPIAVAASASHCHVATLDGDAIIARGYDRPSWTLRHQGSVTTPDPRTRWAVSSDGHFFGWSLPEGEEGKPDGPPTLLLPWRQPSSLAVGREGELPVAIAAAETGVAVAMRGESGVRVVAFAKDLGAMRSEIVLAGATSANLRIVERAVVVADDQGRVIAVDIEDGTLLRDLRI